jgi:hypothetical protein
LYFEPNLGQAPGGVRYLTRTPGATILLRDTEAVIQLRRAEAEGQDKRAIVRMRLAGAVAPRQVEPLQKLPGISNYFVGRDPKQWRTDIPQYRRVRYERVYPGVDLVYYGNGAQLQYDFTVEPGAEPGKIQLQFDGMKRLRIEESGDLLLETALGDLRLAKPVVYQESEAGRKPVEAGYRLLAEGKVGFTIGEYDRSRRLVIDPTLVYSTYLGGANFGDGVAVDAAGNAYIVGYTYENDFPTVNPVQAGLIYGPDVFVSKLNSTGTALVWSTYLGGSGLDIGREIAVDASGNAYITGFTSSSDFPVVNAAQSTHGGGDYDVFVAKLSSGGNSLVYSTFLGGSDLDSARSIAVNPSSGDAYVTGYTYSTDFPVQSAYQAALSGYSNAFVAKFDSAGVRQFSTYLGGGVSDMGNGVALDGSGNAYVTGYTTSDNFPTTAGVVQTSRKGSSDAFVTKMASDGSSLIYSTYLGGSDSDRAIGIAVHSSGRAYITGETSSGDFPTTDGVVRPSKQGAQDGFVAKLNIDGTALDFATFLGGGQLDYPQGIAVDEPAGNVYITGYTYSGDFPMANALQPVKPNSGTVLYRTGDGGGSWGQVDTGLAATTVFAVSVDPGTPATVVAATDFGIYRSTDSGTNWSGAWSSTVAVTTIFTPAFLARSPSNPSILYAVYDFRRVRQSTDGGSSWVSRGNISSGYSIQALAVHPTIPGTLYAATFGGGVYQSVDSGASWTQVNNGLGSLSVLSLAIDPSNANVMYAGTSGSGVYKTTDGAANWGTASTGMSGGEIYALAMDPGNSSVLYAARDNCIYKTTNAAANWNSMGCLGSIIYGLVVAPSNSAVLYAGTASHGVWRSADSGVTWNPANSGIADRYINGLAVHPTDASVVYAGTSGTSDAFVSKLNAAGTAFVYSTYLGGPQGMSAAYGIAADASGNAYVTGYTSSYSFPTTAGALKRSSQTELAFVSKISAATASCSYDVNPASQFFYSGGGTANFSVVSPSGCAWTATPGAGWIGVTAGSSGTGVGAVSISVSANSGAARSADLDVGGQTIVITQAASGCSYSLSPSSLSFPAAGGNWNLTVTAGTGCDWVAQNPYSWITATPSGSGSGGVTVDVAANPGLDTRSAQLVIGGQNLSITQGGPAASSFQCMGTSVSPLVRSESIADLAGDIGLICLGSPPSSGITGNLRVTLNTNITSRLVSLPSTTEALLLIDDPAPGSLVVGTNAFRGIRVSDTEIEFQGVPFAPPGQNPLQFARITNVRANAVAVGNGGSVYAVVSVLASTSVPVTNNVLPVANVRTGFSFETRGCDNSSAAAGRYSQCTGLNSSLYTGASTDGPMQSALRFTEGFTSAFKPRVAPGQDPSSPGVAYKSESGYVNTSVLGAETGFATQGTRLIARFQNVPAGVRLFVTTAPLSTSSSHLSAVLVATDSAGAGPFSAVSSTGTGTCPQSGDSKPIAEVTLSGGSGFAVWEITEIDDLSYVTIESVSFGVVVAYSGGSPGLGTATVSGVLAPLSTVTTMNEAAPAPRFVDAAVPVSAFSIAACVAEKVATYIAGAWKLDANGNGGFDAGVDPSFNWGWADTTPVHGDWNGDGTDEAGFFINGLWYLDYNGNGVWDGEPTDKMYAFGMAGVEPKVGDWNGDGKDEIGIYINGFWFLDMNGNGIWDGEPTDKMIIWGFVGSTPVTGDWNGDGRTKVGLYKDGLWYLDVDGNGIWDGGTTDKMIPWGWTGTTPVHGDWNGDGKEEVGVYLDGFWYLDMDGNGIWDGGTTDKMIILGWSGTTPVVGDWSGDGKTKVGTYINGYWYLDYNGNGVWDGEPTDKAYLFGQGGDMPVVGRW